MRLPRLPNGFVKARTQTMQFLGINLTENYQDGELADSKNLSTLQYPTLTQRKGREELTGYESVSDMYEWDGKLIVVSNGQLYVDGEPIVSVSDTKKQFAVVNTKLIVFPDKISIDLKNNELKSMEGTVVSSGEVGSVTFTTTTLTADLESKIETDKNYGYLNKAPNTRWYPYIYTYGDDLTAVEACWNNSNNSWNMTALNALKQDSYCYSPNFFSVSGSYRKFQEGDIFIPEFTEYVTEYASGSVIRSCNYYPVHGQKASTDHPAQTPDTTKYNDRGYVCIITDIYRGWVSSDGTFEYRFRFDVYDVSNDTIAFSSVFEVGDMVDITGTKYGLLDTKVEDDESVGAKLKISAISEPSQSTPNKLTFSNANFKMPYATLELTADKKPDYYYVRVNDSENSGQYYYYGFHSRQRMLKGQVIVVYAGTGDYQYVYVWDPKKLEVVGKYMGWSTGSNGGNTYTSLGNTTLYDTSTEIISVSRSIPDMDFICERDNRLWGVSNKTKTIYCSALGIPWAFYDYSGLDTDSYAVAVGSSGDFTGIVSYGGVLCFKENKVHKMLGNFPSDFYMTTYDIPGIQKGAHHSAVIVSEILYYRSPLGVMAFTGYQPTNISQNLALENTVGGVAGTNGREYFICVQAKDGSHYTLFKYDLQLKLWMKEEDIDISSMAGVGGSLYITVRTPRQVTVDGEPMTVYTYTPYRTGVENDEGMDLEWFAQFCPHREVAGGIRQAGYTRLILRFDMAPGSMFTIKTRMDDWNWKQAWTQVATNKLSHTVPLKIGRCEKFEVRLEGKGQTKIRSIQREFVQGGWFDNGAGFYR